MFQLFPKSYGMDQPKNTISIFESRSSPSTTRIKISGSLYYLLIEAFSVGNSTDITP